MKEGNRGLQLKFCISELEYIRPFVSKRHLYGIL